MAEQGWEFSNAFEEVRALGCVQSCRPGQKDCRRKMRHDISEDRDDGWHETFGGGAKHEGCYCEAHANNRKKYGNQNHRNRSQSLYKTTFAASLLRVLSSVPRFPVFAQGASISEKCPTGVLPPSEISIPSVVLATQPRRNRRPSASILE